MIAEQRRGVAPMFRWLFRGNRQPECVCMIKGARHVLAGALITLAVVLGPVFIAAPAIGQMAKDQTIRLDSKADNPQRGVAEDKLALDRKVSAGTGGRRVCQMTDGRTIEWSFPNVPFGVIWCGSADLVREPKQKPHAD
jgi:hypothetical protein